MPMLEPRIKKKIGSAAIFLWGASLVVIVNWASFSPDRSFTLKLGEYVLTGLILATTSLVVILVRSFWKGVRLKSYSVTKYMVVATIASLLFVVGGLYGALTSYRSERIPPNQASPRNEYRATLPMLALSGNWLCTTPSGSAINTFTLYRDGTYSQGTETVVVESTRAEEIKERHYVDPWASWVVLPTSDGYRLSALPVRVNSNEGTLDIYHFTSPAYHCEKEM